MKRVRSRAGQSHQDELLKRRFFSDMTGRIWLQRCFLTLALLAVFSSLAQACPTCKQAIVEGGNHASVVRGYFWSIVFMMSMPFLIFGSLGTYFYLQVVRARVAQAESSAHAGTVEPVAAG